MPDGHMRTAAVLAILLLVGVFAIPVRTAGPSFHPDATLKGSTLTGWHTLGSAAWRIDNGELVGTPAQATGGWLVLDAVGPVPHELQRHRLPRLLGEIPLDASRKAHREHHVTHTHSLTTTVPGVKWLS